MPTIYQRARQPRPTISPAERAAIGSRILVLRERELLTQRELGGRLGFTSQRLSNLERGKVTPRLAEVIALGEALGATLDELVHGRVVESAAAPRVVALLRELNRTYGLDLAAPASGEAGADSERPIASLSAETSRRTPGGEELAGGAARARAVHTRQG
ncbi:MAG TPA: helix-turn-helix transcriptional regulator [Thermoanaerobaculia bacterium]|nr:helix-turn-helix transcriptional regulator [Thermoanaerobaculia bacterium]